MSMLKVKDLKVNYGGIEALKGISFDVEQGQIVTLIGANGAGKSTTLRAISGLVKTASGAINFLGRDIIPFNAQQVVAEGIAMVPEGRRVFDNLTVLENLKIGAYLRSDKEEVQAGIEDIFQRFPRLKEREWQLAGTLSGGEQQMLAVGRAMMARPKLLMMDEPSLGLAPLVVRDIFSIIRDLKSEGITILQRRPALRRSGLRPRDGPHHHVRHRRGPAGRPARSRRLFRVNSQIIEYRGTVFACHGSHFYGV